MNKKSINYVTFQQEKINNNLDILKGCLDGLLKDIEVAYERKLKFRGDISALEVLSYLKYKLDKPIESFYYGYESFKLDRTSVGIVYAALSLITIKNNHSKKFIEKYKHDIVKNIYYEKFNINNIDLKDGYMLIKLLLTK